MKDINDTKIIELSNKIDKSLEIKNTENKKFIPKTCLVITVDGKEYNINVLSKQDLLMLLLKLNSYKMSAENFIDIRTFDICEYNIEDWICDIKNKYDILNNKEKIKNAEKIKSKLNSLLSSDKKVEIEISNLENEINNL